MSQLRMVRQGMVVFGLSFVLGSPSVGEAAEVVKSEEHAFRVELVAEGLQVPWGMVQLPDGTYLVTERPGKVQRIGPDGVREIGGVPEVWARGQGGLLDIELHPDYEETGWIYLAYSKPLPGGGMTAIVRARLKGDSLVDHEMIFDPPPEQATGGANHWGCRMEFDGKGYLFFTIGDRGTAPDARNLAQNLGHAAGKIHRIFEDGRVPEDNPFVGQEGAWPTVWAWGSRNAQGLKIRPENGQLWAVEHGPKGGDELNLIRRGANYGWPVVSHGVNYDGTSFTDKTEAPGMEPPVLHWTPSIAVGGMDFYRGDRFPRWKGNVFVTALAGQKLVRITLDGDRVVGQEELLRGTGRIRDVRVFGGQVYVIYDQPGKIIRLVPLEDGMGG